MTKTTYVVAVWWPKDASYGGIQVFYELAAADHAAEELRRLHYGYKRNPIHIIRRTSDEIVKIIDDANEKE